jgi:hypothetical protein
MIRYIGTDALDYSKFIFSEFFSGKFRKILFKTFNPYAGMVVDDHAFNGVDAAAAIWAKATGACFVNLSWGIADIRIFKRLRDVFVRKRIAYAYIHFGPRK